MYDIESLIDDDVFDEFRRSVVRASQPPVLRDAKIKLTSRCNLRCTMCHYWQTRTEDALTTDEWRSVLSQLADLSCRKVHFSGGEVFLRRDFLDLVEHTTALGMKANMTTNGTLVDKHKARRLARSGANSVSISLDGPNARIHDQIRGQDGAFKKSLRTIGWMKRFEADVRRPVKLRVNFVVMRKNYRRLPEMVRLAGELGAIDLNPMPIDEKGERKNRLSRSQIEEYNRDIAPQVHELRQEYGFSLDRERVYPFGVTREEIDYSRRGLYAQGYFERRPCLAPWLHSFFAWNGDTYLCCMTNGRMESLGNVRQTPVRDVFRGAAYDAIRAAFVAGRARPECHRCDLFPAENARLNSALAATAPARITPMVSTRPSS